MNYMFILLILFLFTAAMTPTAIAEPYPSMPRSEWSQYFPKNYDDARDVFEAMSKAHGGYWEQHRIEGSENLSVDTTLFKGEHSSRLLVMQSGLHGSEAGAGAAVEQLLIRNYVDKLRQEDIDIYIIHATNPWGFKHNRRVDAWNVNLNRNFSNDDACKSWTLGTTHNAYYNKLRSLFEPTGPIRSVSMERLLIGAEFIGIYVLSGFDSMPINVGFDSGQYEFDKGMNYGGRAAAWQTTFFCTVVKPILSNYQQILFLDFHTGLGKSGVLAVIKGIAPSEVRLKAFEDMIDVHAPPNNASRSDNPEHGVVLHSGQDEGFFPTTGDIIDFVPALFKNEPDKVLAVTMEYGTIGSDMGSQIDSAARMIMENQKYNNGGVCSRKEICDEADNEFRELFYPSSEVWRARVIVEAEYVFDRIAGNWN